MSLHQSDIILDYAFSIKTESINNSQDCVSVLVAALQELQNGINTIISHHSQKSEQEDCWPKDVISPLNEVPPEVLNDPFQEVSDATPSFDNFVSEETQQQLESGLLVRWDDKQVCEESGIVIKSLEDKNTVTLEVLNSVFENASEKSWSGSESNAEKFIVENEGSYECQNCNESFSNSSKLESHRVKHHALPSSCDLCGKSFSSVSALQVHCKNEHEGAGCFACPTCKKRFMLRLSYERHLKSHNPSLTAVCEICGKAFKRADYMKRHYMMHSKKRPHSCDVCEKTFSSPSSLKIHKTQVHEQLKDHPCDKCGKKFARMDKLKEHLKRHENVRKHECEFCHRKYVEKRDLRIHLPKCGPGAEPFTKKSKKPSVQ
ncbi:zinc finger protein 239-like [Neocloeon triangulifer]|uniref:zinc finger protein 239-like n=1 Tax=Neocloeon triangulifer TaxID=2078957 RepID=UPI00286F8941|nr:zinc finger protein 239-like [Neocloeon triangulifer]